MKRYLQTINEVASILPRVDGGEGVASRYAAELIKTWGIKKTKRGWPTKAILEKAREHVEKEPAADALDAEIKRRKLRLLDIEIGKADETLCEVPQVIERMTALHADMSLRVGTWRESNIAKHPALRKEIEAITRELQTALAEAVT